MAKKQRAAGFEIIVGAGVPDSTNELGHKRIVAPQRRKTPSQPTPVIDANEIDWKNTRALSIRQPWAELVISGGKPVEYRNNATRIRGRIAIYASLSKVDLTEAAGLGLNPDELPRGVLIGTVELYDCAGGDWQLRNPQRFAKPLKPTKHPQPVWFYPFGRE